MTSGPPTSRKVTRVILAVGVLVGLFLLAYPLVLGGRLYSIGGDFQVYRTAAQALLRGDPFIGLSETPPVHQVYVYPPITVLFFVPHAVLPSALAFALHLIINVTAALVVGGLTVSFIERLQGRLPTLDRGLLVGFCSLSTLPLVVIGLGNIDLPIAALLAVGFLTVEAGRERIGGAAVGLAAVFKLFPVVVGLWLLRRRGFRAMLAALLVGVGAVLASLLVFGVALHRRFLKVLLFRGSASTFRPGQGWLLSLSDAYSQLAPGLDPATYPLVTAVAVAPFVLAAYAAFETVEDRLVAYLVTIVAMVLVVPTSLIHYGVYALFPLLSTLYLVDDAPSRALLLAGLGCLAVPFQSWFPASLATTLGVNEWYGQQLAPVVESLLSVASLPTYGFLFILLGCAAFGIRRSGWSRSSVTVGLREGE